MVHKKYIEKNGKRYGPYYYESYRDSEGHVKKRYIAHPKKSFFETIKTSRVTPFVILFALLAVTFAYFYITGNPFTGGAVSEILPVYSLGENLSGQIKFNLRAGEFIPADAVVKIKNGDQTREVLLSELIVNQQKTSGDFYLENSELSGQGEGFGVAGKKITYPEVLFKLAISEKDSSSIIPSENETTTPEANETETNQTIIETPESEINETESSSESETPVEIEPEVPTEIQEPTSEEIVPEENPETLESETSSETTLETTEPSSVLTGAVISGESQIIQGVVKKGQDYSYTLPENTQAEIVSGSAKVQDVSIDDSYLKLSTENNQAVVSTNYEIVEEGFGKDYLGGYDFTLELNLSEFEINVSEPLVELFVSYNDTILLQAESLILIEGQENITENLTLGNISLIQEIPSQEIKKNEQLELDLGIYFINAVGYEFIAQNISAEISGNNLILIPDENYTGISLAKIIAYSQTESIESNQFEIIVSSSEVNITTNSSPIRLGQPVKWTTNVSMDSPEMVKVNLPVEATNIVVKEKKKESNSELLENPLIENKTETNQTVQQNETETNQTEIIETNETLEESTPEIGEEINQTLQENENLTSEASRKKIQEVVVEVPISETEVESSGIITGNAVVSFNLNKQSRVNSWVKNFYSLITGNVVEEQQEVISPEILVDEVSRVIEVELPATSTEYVIEYETPAPISFEQDLVKGKQVTVSGPDNLNYQNVIAFTTLNESLGLKNPSRLKIEWVESGGYKILPLAVLDTDSNGIYDYVEWIVPHLSNQTFNIIVITRAEHLDENKIFISDIFDEVRYQDDIWSEEILENQYVRVTFEQSLTSNQDITVLPEIVSGNPRIEVYEKDGSEIIAEFSMLEEDELNKVFLTGLEDRQQDTFDLKVVGGSVKFDYITDPQREFYVYRDSYFTTSTTLNVNIPEVNTSRAFILHTFGVSNDDPGSLLWNAKFLNSTTVQLTRKGVTVERAYIDFEVIEHEDLTVQQGNFTSDASTLSYNININSVNLSNSFIIVSGASKDYLTTSYWVAQFVNSTRFNITRGRAIFASEVVWQVVSWDGATVQSGLNIPSSTPATVDITAVNLSRSFIISSQTSNATSTNTRDIKFQTYFVDNNTLAFHRVGTANNGPKLSWFVVSHPSILVQRGFTSFSAATTWYNSTLSPSVDDGASFSISTNNANAANNYFCRAEVRRNITATGNYFQARKEYQTTGVNVSWFVVSLVGQWPWLTQSGAFMIDDIGANSTHTSKATNFYARFNDTQALHPNGQYIFSTNNSDSWVNDSAVNFTATPSWANVTKTLTHHSGAVVGYMWYVKDTDNHWTDTGIQTLTALDTTPPTYSNITYNNTVAGQPTKFNVELDDETFLDCGGVCSPISPPSQGGFIFSTNNTGTWVNDTHTHTYMGYGNLTKVLNSTSGKAIGFRWYFNDTGNNWNETGINVLVTIASETDAPTYSNIDYNASKSGAATLFSSYWQDVYALHAKGQYIFSTNNTGTWVNDSAINFTTTPSWANVTKVLNSTGGIVVGYRWYAKDNSSNWNSTGINVVTTVNDNNAPTYDESTVDMSCAPMIYTGDCGINWSDDIALQTKGEWRVSYSLDGSDWANKTEISYYFSTTPQRVTGSFMCSEGQRIRCIFYARDNAGNWNASPIYASSDIVSPRYSNINYNSSKSGQSSLFSIYWNDSDLEFPQGLSPNGQYIFSTNNTGSWANDSAVNFTTALSWANVTKTLSSTVGAVIGYRWYANDNASNWNSTEINTLTVTDGASPTYSNVAHSSTQAESSSVFSVYWNDNAALNPNGKYIFSTNNTGSWQNDSPVAFSTTPSWANVTKTLSSTVGAVIGYRWYANDTANNWNSTAIQTLTITDAIAPTYSNIAHNSSNAGRATLFSVYWDDNIFLNPNGKYIFSTNNTGTWVNDTPVAFSTTPSWANVTKTLNTTGGKVIGYRWYANDSYNNWNSTSIQTLTTVDITPPTYSNIAHNNTNAGQATLFSAYWNDETALAGGGRYIFSTNNTGTWVNDTSVAFSTTPSWANVTKTLNNTAGLVIGYRWYANDTANNWNATEINTLSSSDIVAPTYSGIGHTSTQAGASSTFSITWNDNIALNPNGQYIFSTNNSGSWANDSAVNFTTTPDAIDSVKTLTTNVGAVVGYMWYAKDNAGNWNVTTISTLTTTDAIAPTYSSLAHNSSNAGRTTLFSAYWNDNLALNPNGKYIFSTNNTGTWVNDTPVAFTTTPSWANVTKTLNTTGGKVIGYRWYANDTANNWNSTAIQTLTTVDITPPTYSNVAHNTTQGGSAILFSAYWNDETALAGGGRYIFSTNNTGTWVNDTPVAFSTTPSWANVTKTLNTTFGAVIGYRWYANDSSNNWNSSTIATVTVGDAIAPTYSSLAHNSSNAGRTTLFSAYWNDNLALNPNGKYIFSTNNTGTWVNDTPVAFTTTPSWANVTKTLNTTFGSVIGYRWYANDTANNWNSSTIQTLTTVPEGAVFSSVWNTSKTSTGSTSSNQVGLPLESSGVYNFIVNWGDGKSDLITSYNQAEVNHTYSSAGEYTINITGTIQGFRFNNVGDKLKLVDIKSWGPLNLGNSGNYFYGCSTMRITATDVLNLTGTTTMYYAFGSASNLTTVPSMNEWDMSNITTMASMFNGATNFNQNISNWNTSKVNSMIFMFYSATNFNQSLANWDISKVTNIYYMFSSATNFNQNISNWDTSNVTNMEYLFGSATNFNQNISNWNTSKVTDMSSMFRYATNFNQNISNWNTSKVTDMSSMFQSATNFNQSLANWDTSKATDMSFMFSSATNFNQNISSWDTSNVTLMNRMFASASNFNQNLSEWNTSKVTTMSGMFYYASNFNQTVGTWDLSQVTDTKEMFRGASKFNQPIGNWNTSNVTTMWGMFYYASKFNQPIGNWNTSKVTDLGYMFSWAQDFNQPLSNWNTKSVGNMNYTFELASDFNQNLSNWNVSNLSTASDMLYGLTLSTPNYDSLLTGWASQTPNLKNSVPFSGGNSKYCAVSPRNDTLIGIHSWAITDGGEDPNCNTAPNDPVVTINSTDGSNKTLQDLNCKATITDPEANAMNVSVRWWKNNTLNLTQDFNNTYANGTLFNATLGNGNTTKGDVWKCEMRLYDGELYSNWTNSSNLTILNSLPTVTLSSPPNGNVTTDRTPTFSWTGADDDGDSLTYQLGIILDASSTCSDPDRNITGIASTSHTLTQDLRCLIDNGDFYLWTVAANDGVGYGAWPSQRNISIMSLIEINLTNRAINFGAMAQFETNDTTDNNPLPFKLQNIGNAFVNVTVEGSSLWQSATNPTQYLKYKAANRTNASSFNFGASITGFAMLPAQGSPEMCIAELNYTDGNDVADIDIYVEVPPNEYASANRYANITFTASLAE